MIYLLIAILVLLIVLVLWEVWIGTVLHNMIQGLYRSEEHNATE